MEKKDEQEIFELSENRLILECSSGVVRVVKSRKNDINQLCKYNCEENFPLKLKGDQDGRFLGLSSKILLKLIS